jgi:hypothetical protein
VTYVSNSRSSAGGTEAGESSTAAGGGLGDSQANFSTMLGFQAGQSAPSLPGGALSNGTQVGAAPPQQNLAPSGTSQAPIASAAKLSDVDWALVAEGVSAADGDTHYVEALLTLIDSPDFKALPAGEKSAILAYLKGQPSAVAAESVRAKLQNPTDRKLLQGMLGNARNEVAHEQRIASLSRGDPALAREIRDEANCRTPKGFENWLTEKGLQDFSPKPTLESMSRGQQMFPVDHDHQPMTPEQQIMWNRISPGNQDKWIERNNQKQFMTGPGHILWNSGASDAEVGFAEGLMAVGGTVTAAKAPASEPSAPAIRDQPRPARWPNVAPPANSNAAPQSTIPPGSGQEPRYDPAAAPHPANTNIRPDISPKPPSEPASQPVPVPVQQQEFKLAVGAGAYKPGQPDNAPRAAGKTQPPVPAGVPRVYGKPRFETRTPRWPVARPGQSPTKAAGPASGPAEHPFEAAKNAAERVQQEFSAVNKPNAKLDGYGDALIDLHRAIADAHGTVSKGTREAAQLADWQALLSTCVSQLKSRADSVRPLVEAAKQRGSLSPEAAEGLKELKKFTDVYDRVTEQIEASNKSTARGSGGSWPHDETTGASDAYVRATGNAERAWSDLVAVDEAVYQKIYNASGYGEALIRLHEALADLKRTMPAGDVVALAKLKDWQRGFQDRLGELEHDAKLARAEIAMLLKTPPSRERDERISRSQAYIDVYDDVLRKMKSN